MPAISIDPTLIRIFGESDSVEATVVAVDGQALLLRGDSVELERPARAIITAFGRDWEWTRLTTTRRADGSVVLTTDDERDRAVLWSLFYEAKRALPGEESSLDGRADEIPFRGHATRDKAERRIAWLKARSDHPLSALTASTLDPSQLQGNIEQFVGSVEIPVGIVGPLLFKGEHVRGHVVAPFATSEGALVSSATRGAKALSLAGGVTTRFIHQRMCRAPVFVMRSIEGAARFAEWVRDHGGEVRAQAESASRHAKLVEIEPVQIGRYVHVRFLYETGDAAGQNMATFCTWRACAFIQSRLTFVSDVDIAHFFIEGNASGDKKLTHLAYHAGRGMRVIAEATLSAQVSKRALNASPMLLMEAFEAGSTGSTYAGMVGMNVNVANVVAALFAATGQDLACIHESSAAQFHLKLHDDGILATLLLPSLVIGTVGGGTRLPSQADALRVLGCAGAGRARRLAEIIAGFALGLELSTLAAVATGDFVAAHRALGRPQDDAGLRADDLTSAFFEDRLREGPAFAGELPRVVRASVADEVEGDGVLGQFVAGRTRKKLGIFPCDLELDDGRKVRLALKSKPRDVEVVEAMTNVARLCGEPLATLFEAHASELGFRGCHVRELRIAELDDPRFVAIAPRTYFTYQKDPTDVDPRAIYLLATELLEGMTHMATTETPEAWTAPDIEIALDGIASFHAVHLRATGEIERASWLEVATPAEVAQRAPLWEAVLEYNRLEYSDVYTDARVRSLLAWLRDLRAHLQALETAPRTLVHNDFNPRNLALRPLEGGGRRLCAFDWELATLHVPQRDVCEFLAWVVPPGEGQETRRRFVAHYRTRLEAHSGLALPRDEFDAVYRLACFDFATTRLGMYNVAHGFRSLDWVRRVTESHLGWLEQAYA